LYNNNYRLTIMNLHSKRSVMFEDTVSN